MNNCKVHVLCNDQCLPYVFSEDNSRKYAIVFKDLDFKKIANNNSFLSMFDKEASSISQIVFKRIDKEEKSLLNGLQDIKLVDTRNNHVSMMTINEFDRFL